MTSTMTSAVASFERDGFLRLPQAITPTALEAAHAEYAAVLSANVDAWRAAGKLDGGEDLVELPFVAHASELCALPDFDRSLLGALECTLPYAPFSVVTAESAFHVGQGLLDLIREVARLDVVQQMLGPEILASPNQHCRIKPPDAKASEPTSPVHINYSATPWHQDAITHVEESDATTNTTCWIAMVDVTENDGCLVVAPGEHQREELLPWPVPDEMCNALDQRSVPLPARAGDVLLLHKRLPHASAANRSNNLRWSFDVRLYPAGSPSDRPWYPSILVRSDAHPELEVTDAADWREAWEAARQTMIATRQPCPGRPAHARMTANALITQWSNGDFHGHA